MKYRTNIVSHFYFVVSLINLRSELLLIYLLDLCITKIFYIPMILKNKKYIHC